MNNSYDEKYCLQPVDLYYYHVFQLSVQKESASRLARNCGIDVNSIAAAFRVLWLFFCASGG